MEAGAKKNQKKRDREKESGPTKSRCADDDAIAESAEYMRSQRYAEGLY